jgi:hypothetical protein
MQIIETVALTELQGFTYAQNYGSRTFLAERHPILCSEEVLDPVKLFP